MIGNRHRLASTTRRAAGQAALLAVFLSLARVATATPTEPTIALLSDFGTESTTAGLCHAVLAAGLPDARVIDLSHDIPPGDVFLGSIALRRIPYLPPRAIVLGLVGLDGPEPDQLIAFQTSRGFICIGPNDGLFAWVVRLQGIYEAVAIDPQKVDPSYVEGDPDAWRLLCATAARLVENERRLLSIGRAIAQDTIVADNTPEPSASRSARDVKGTTLRVEADPPRVWTNLSQASLRLAGLAGNPPLEMQFASSVDPGRWIPLRLVPRGTELGPPGDPNPPGALRYVWHEDLMVLLPGSGELSPQAVAPGASVLLRKVPDDSH